MFGTTKLAILGWLMRDLAAIITALEKLAVNLEGYAQKELAECDRIEADISRLMSEKAKRTKAASSALALKDKITA
jgi:hypothetical protein